MDRKSSAPTTFPIHLDMRRCIVLAQSTDVGGRLDWLIGRVSWDENIVNLLDRGVGGVQDVVNIVSQHEYDNDVLIAFFRVTLGPGTSLHLRKSGIVRCKYVHVVYIGPQCDATIKARVATLNHDFRSPFNPSGGVVFIQTSNPIEELTPARLEIELRKIEGDAASFDFTNRAFIVNKPPSPVGGGMSTATTTTAASNDTTTTTTTEPGDDPEAIIDLAFRDKASTSNELITLLVNNESFLFRAENESLRHDLYDRVFRKRGVENYRLQRFSSTQPKVVRRDYGGSVSSQTSTTMAQVTSPSFISHDPNALLPPPPLDIRLPPASNESTPNQTASKRFDTSSVSPQEPSSPATDTNNSNSDVDFFKQQQLQQPQQQQLPSPVLSPIAIGGNKMFSNALDSLNDDNDHDDNGEGNNNNNGDGEPSPRAPDDEEPKTWEERALNVFDDLCAHYHCSTISRDIFRKEMSIEYRTASWERWGADRMFDQMCDDGEETLSREAFVRGMAQYRFLRQIIGRDPGEFAGRTKTEFNDERVAVINRLRDAAKDRGGEGSSHPLSKIPRDRTAIHDKVIADRYLKTDANNNPWLVYFTQSEVIGDDLLTASVQTVEWMDRSGVLPLELFVYLDPSQIKKDHRSASGKFTLSDEVGGLPMTGGEDTDNNTTTTTTTTTTDSSTNNNPTTTEENSRPAAAAVVAVPPPPPTITKPTLLGSISTNTGFSGSMRALQSPMRKAASNSLLGTSGNLGFFNPGTAPVGWVVPPPTTATTTATITTTTHDTPFDINSLPPLLSSPRYNNNNIKNNTGGRPLHSFANRAAANVIVEDTEADWVCLVAQEAAMRESQHVVSFVRRAPTEAYVARLRKQFDKYRIACVCIQNPREVLGIRPQLKTPDEVRHASEKGVYDIVVWVEASANFNSLITPPISLTMGNPVMVSQQHLFPPNSSTKKLVNDGPQLLAVQNNQGLWHQGLGRLFSDDFERRRPFPESLETLYICPTQLGRIFSNDVDTRSSLKPGDIFFEQLNTPNVGGAPDNINDKRAFFKKQGKLKHFQKKLLLMSAELDREKVSANLVVPLKESHLEIQSILDSCEKWNYADSGGLQIMWQDTGAQLFEDLKDKWAWHVVCHTDSLNGRSPTLCLRGSHGGCLFYETDQIVDICRAASVVNGGRLTVVVLNTCLCSELARRLSSEAGIPYVITWETRVLDEAARLFAEGFWLALASDIAEFAGDKRFYDVEAGVTKAFKEGKMKVKTALSLNSYGEETTTFMLLEPTTRRLRGASAPDEESANNQTDDNNGPRYVGSVRLFKQKTSSDVKHGIKVKLTLVKPDEMSLETISQDDFRRVLTDLNDGNVYLNLSPINPTTLDNIARERARIPTSARYYCFASPEQSFDRRKGHAFVKDIALDPNLLFFRNGGYIYFDLNRKVLQVNAVTTENGQSFGILNFQTPVLLHKLFPPKDSDRAEQLVSILESKGRFHKVVIEDFFLAKARYFAWVYPNEIIAGHQFPQHGSFIFLFRELDEGVTPLDRYFAVRGRKVA
jgi:hypothetical protein